MRPTTSVPTTRVRRTQSLRAARLHWNTKRHTVIPVVALFLLVACGDDTTDTTPRDSSPPRSGDSGVTNAWSVETITEHNAGQGISLTVTSDGPVVAYLASVGMTEGPCEEVRVTPTETPPDKTFFDVYVATRSGRSWSEEAAARILSQSNPAGVDIASDNGSVMLAALTGEPYANLPLNAYCGANDLGLYSAPNWNPMALVTASGEAPVDAASDAGFAVGFWPAIAFGGGTGIIAYRDVHFGGLQSDDERRADLEAVINTGGGWNAVPVDPGRGAGQYSDAVVDASGNPYIAYVNSFEFDDESRGTLVARSMDDGGTWEIVRLSTESEQGPSLWFDENGQLHVAFYDASRGQMVLATNTNESMFANFDAGWATEFVGDAQFDEGRDPSGVSGGNGLVAVAYYRCARPGARGCEPDDDALVLAWKDNDNTEWTYEVVDDGPAGGICGDQASLGMDSFGALWVAYLCQNVDGSEVGDRVRVAERDAF